MGLLIKNDFVFSFKTQPLSNGITCVAAADSTPLSSSRAIFHSERRARRNEYRHTYMNTNQSNTLNDILLHHHQDTETKEVA